MNISTFIKNKNNMNIVYNELHFKNKKIFL